MPVPRSKKSKGRWFRWILLICIGSIVLSCIGVSGYVGWSLTHPNKKPIVNFPESYQLAYQTVEFKSRADGTLLRGWLIAGNPDRERIVIFAHGYRDNRSDIDAVLPTAKALHNKGIASLLFDFRNSGESDGTFTSVGEYEKGDLLAAIDYAKQLGYKQIGLIGYSMGASTSILAAAESKDVKAVIADSPFADLRPYLEDNLPVWSHLPSFPFTWLIMFEITHITDMDPDKVRPIIAIQKLRDRPILLIHAVGDHSIPIQNSEQLKQASASDNTILWEAPGDHHIGTYDAVPEEYLRRVVDFMDQNLPATK
jgi:uncharacterized protein